MDGRKSKTDIVTRKGEEQDLKKTDGKLSKSSKTIAMSSSQRLNPVLTTQESFATLITLVYSRNN